MGILALVLYVLGVLQIYSEQGIHKMGLKRWQLVTTLALWPVFVVAGLFVAIHEKLSK